MGFHWTRCNPLAGALAPITVLIICSMVAPKLPAITRELVHGLEWCSAILAAGMVAGAILNRILMRILVPRHIIWIRGTHDYIGYQEAPDGIESHRQANIGNMGRYYLPPSKDVPLLLGSPYEREESRQLQLHERRDTR